ncbi:TPA_asm: P1 protein [Cardamom polerovirus]|uniref:P1 protein n=1 Tax=Cardamom polerovirus TaxID=2754871 RepID=A0AAD2QFW7_9VIRU|nr:TPA_asm: P1 protein [Cardamom polerovirus]
MGIITLLSVLSALFCLFFHFFYAHTLPSINLGTLNYHNRTPWLLPNGARPWDLPPDTGFQTSQCSPCPSCPTPNPTEFSYKDLCQGVWQKLLMDLTLDHTGLSVGSNNMWGRIREIFGNLTSATIAKMLWLSVTVWSGVLWVLASAVWGMFSSYTAPTLLLLLLYFLTKSLCQVVRWIFGSSLLRIMSTPMRITFRVLKSKTSFHNEKRVIGHESFEIPQDPPKSSVLQLISICSGKEEHVGYANCVRLYNNENALITCAHVGEDVLVKGKTGNAIQIGKFCPLYYSRDTDLVILTGPPNWEGVLGCKGVHFVTSDKIAPSPVNIYFKKGVIPKFSEDKIDESTNPQWMTSFGKLTGVYKGFVQVLSNTEAGFSGSGYFSGKTLVGIHKGHVGTEFNFNLMVPIPPIRGITSPSYVYETTNIKGRVFADDVISRIADDAEKIYRLIEANKLIKFQSATGVNWADYVDESSRSPPHPAEVPLPSLMVRENPTPTQRGNGLRSPVCETTEARSPSLMASENPIPLMGNGLRGSVRGTTGVSPIHLSEQDDTKLFQQLYPNVDPCLENLYPVITPTAPLLTPPGTGSQTPKSTAVPMKVEFGEKEMMSEIIKCLVDKISTNQISKKSKPKRGKRGAKNKQQTSAPSSPDSMLGTQSKLKLHQMVSDIVAGHPPSTTPKAKQKQNGGEGSASNTQSWVRKSKDSAGPSRDLKPK